MARIITFASSKGGTGKSCVVANLGVAMSRLGKRVMLLDADITMANLGLMLGLEGRKITLHDVLAGEVGVSRAIYRGPEGVKVVPCGISLNGIQRAKIERLKKVVVELAKKTKFLFIDAPSGLDRDAIIAMTLAPEVILITTPNILSLSNALKTKIVAERLGVKPLGVIINRITGGDLDLPIDEIKSVLELPVLGMIPEDREMRRAMALGEPVITHAPKSPSTREFKRIAAELK
ncbi:MAG: cell division ATPase MinD [Hadesarchaea archaeon]|nr:cell division ATPase MinD [Hadesarchaea archaeon]